MLNEYVGTFKALGEPTRMKIIKLLSVQEMCVCEIEEILQMSQPRISQHLKILKYAGLANERKDGRWIYYSLNNEYLNAVLTDFNKMLAADLANLADFKDEYERYLHLDCNEEVRNCRAGAGKKS